MTSHPFALYNPALVPAEDLLAEFTARIPMLETLLDVIRGNLPGHPPQHCLLIGARGMGKTTTLWAIAHRVDRDRGLTAGWQPVVFDEESRRVGDLADFWLECIRQWEHATKSPGGLAERLLQAAPADIEDQAREGFLRLVDQYGRRALLLVDNLNDVLSSIRELGALHRFRAFLMKDSRVMIIGGAARYFDEVTSVDQPFYDFFRYFELRPLTAEEMETCLLTQARHRGDTHVERILNERRGTVRALHLLTGGNPRLVKTFYRLLAEGLRADIRSDLERLMDEFTPYLKAIVDALPVQQQRIFDAVALAWDPVEVGSLSTATRLPSNQVSAQLRSLIKSGLVREAAGSPKRKTYLLADRFSNIHYLMRHGRAARNRLDWFVALVRLVFIDDGSTDILARAAVNAAEDGSDGCLDAHSVLHSGLARASSADERRALLHATLREGWSSPAWESLDQWFDADRARIELPEVDILAVCKTMSAELRKKLGWNPDKAQWWGQLGVFLMERGAWTTAEAAYRKAIGVNPKDHECWLVLGVLQLEKLDRPIQAEASFRTATELEPTCTLAWMYLGLVLECDLGRPAEAEIAYRRAIQLEPQHSAPWKNLGDVLADDLDRPAEAEAAYRRAIELDPNGPSQWLNLGNLLADQLGRPIEAEMAIRKAIALDSTDADAWNDLGCLLALHLSRPEEAVEALRKAAKLAPEDVDILMRLGKLLSTDPTRSEEAELIFRQVVHHCPTNAEAWTKLGVLIARGGKRSQEAEASFRKSIELAPKDPRGWCNLGFLLSGQQGRTSERESAFRAAIELNPEHAPAWSGLADVLGQREDAREQARSCAVKALLLKPSFGFARAVFRWICADVADDWRAVLPQLAAWSIAHPQVAKVFEFTVEGFLRLARLTRPAEVVALLDSLPDITPFQTVRDALVVHDRRDHLLALAPERQALALAILERLATFPVANPTDLAPAPSPSATIPKAA